MKENAKHFNRKPLNFLLEILKISEKEIFTQLKPTNQRKVRKDL